MRRTMLFLRGVSSDPNDEVLFCVLLPPIIFDSGFRMRGAFFWARTPE